MSLEREFLEGFTADLPPWTEVKEEAGWDGILIGNGASRAVWDGFSYNSLFETAQTSIDHPLTAQDVDLFTAFGTENFELVLKP